MYIEHFGLTRPLLHDGIACDDRIYLGPAQKAVQADLELALQRADAVAVIEGPAGTGKSTLAAGALREAATRLAIGCLTDPADTPHELLEQILTEFGFSPYRLSRTERYTQWRQYLSEMAATGSRVGIVVEAADRLEPRLLAELERLTSADIRGGAGATVLLTASRPMAGLLRDEQLAPLGQRCRAVIRVAPLTAEDMRDYLSFRFEAAGGSWDTVAAPEVEARLHEISGGIFRVIDNVVETCLARAAREGSDRITLDLLDRVADQLPAATLAATGNVDAADAEPAPCETAGSTADSLPALPSGRPPDAARSAESAASAAPAEPFSSPVAAEPTAGTDPAAPADSPGCAAPAADIVPAESAAGIAPDEAGGTVEPEVPQSVDDAPEPEAGIQRQAMPASPECGGDFQAASAAAAADRTPRPATTGPTEAAPGTAVQPGRVADAAAPTDSDAKQAGWPAPGAQEVAATLPAPEPVIDTVGEAAAPIIEAGPHGIEPGTTSPDSAYGVTAGAPSDPAARSVDPVVASPAAADRRAKPPEPGPAGSIDVPTDTDIDIPVLDDVVPVPVLTDTDEPIDDDVVDALLSLPGSKAREENDDVVEVATTTGGDLSDEDRQQIEMLEAFANADALEQISESMAETIFGNDYAERISAEVRDAADRPAGARPDEETDERSDDRPGAHFAAGH